MNLSSEFQPIRDWANARNLIEQGDPVTQTVKLLEEIGEIAKALLRKDIAEVRDGIGDACVVLSNLADLVSRDQPAENKFNIEDCINDAYNEIKDRKGCMIDGTFVKGAEPNSK